MNLFGVVVAEFPLHADALALAVAVDTLLVATELWVVSRQ